VCFYFNDPQKARDAFDSIKAWTCKLGRIEKLYAFAYQPQGVEKGVVPNGWGVYNAMREWRRMGVGEKGKGENWRISRLNVDYAVCFLFFFWLSDGDIGLEG
jgi:myotubularin-related protein 6/7/8